MDLNTFIEKYQNQAENVNLKNEEPLAYDILESKKQILENADFENERKDVFDFAQNAITHTKKRLLLAIRNKSYRNNYKGITPPYILELKMYLEYKALWEKSKSNTISHGEKPKNYKTLFHTISFILECYAKKEPLPTGKGWERAGEARKKFTKSGNTFYIEANKIKDKALTKSKLINLIGDDWETIVLELSDDPKILKPYLDTIV